MSMAIEVKIKSLIPEKVEEYTKKYGSTRTWIAKEIGYNSKQSFEGAVISKNPTAETLAKFAVFFNCGIEDLLKIIVIEDWNED